MSAYTAACRLSKPGLPVLLLLSFPLFSLLGQAPPKPSPPEKAKSVTSPVADEPPLNFDLRPINLLQGNADKEAAADAAFMMLSTTYSPDSKLLATAGESKIVRIWDTAARRLRVSLVGNEDVVACVAFAPDGKSVAAAGYDRCVRIWDISHAEAHGNLSPKFTLRGHTNWVFTVVFTPDGKTLASGSYDKSIRLWDAQTGKEKTTLRGHTAAVRALAVAPDGTTLASASTDRTIRLWDLAAGKEVKRLKEHKGGVRALLFTRDGKTLASASEDASIILWDPRGGAARLTIKPSNLNLNNSAQAAPEVWAIAFSPKGGTLVAGGLDNQVRVYDAVTGKLRATMASHTDAVTALAIAPDGSQMATVSYDRSIRIWPASSMPMHALATLPGHRGKVNFALFSPDGKSVATGGDDKVVRISDAATHQSILLRKHTDAVTCADFSRDGKLLATGSRDKTIKLWNAADGKELQTLRGHTGEIRRVQFSRDGKMLVSAGAETSVRVWDLNISGTGGNTKSTFAGDVAALSPDDKLLALSGQVGEKSGPRGTRIVDLATGRVRLVLPPLTHDSRLLLFMGDGKLLMTEGGPSGITVWDLDANKPRQALGNLAVAALAASNDSKTLATGQKDGSVKLWDAGAWRERVTLPAHRASITSVAFSRDGKLLATASQDGTTKLWQIGAGKSALMAGK